MKHRRTQSRMSVLPALPPSSASAPALSAAEAAEPLKIGFVYVSPVGDYGWTFQHELGRRELVERLATR